MAGFYFSVIEHFHPSSRGCVVVIADQGLLCHQIVIERQKLQKGRLFGVNLGVNSSRVSC